MLLGRQADQRATRIDSDPGEHCAAKTRLLVVSHQRTSLSCAVADRARPNPERPCCFRHFRTDPGRLPRRARPVRGPPHRERPLLLSFQDSWDSNGRSVCANCWISGTHGSFRLGVKTVHLPGVLSILNASLSLRRPLIKRREGSKHPMKLYFFRTNILNFRILESRH